jgi:phenylalanine-4-hydroxylase
MEMNLSRVEEKGKTLLGQAQVYENYTEEDHQVWKILFDKQKPNIEQFACKAFKDGLDKVGFTPDHIPDFEKTNQVLLKETGWQLIAVPGIVNDEEFFELMASRKFPATTWLRKMDEIDYLEEPDMFHDVFAHVPLLTNAHFADFLHALSHLGLKYLGNTEAIELLSRIYWYTVEFGLIREEELRIYGAGILSSAGETHYSVSKDPVHLPYNVESTLQSAYRKDVFQERYFIIDSFEQLYASLDAVTRELDTALNMLIAGKAV